MRSEETPVDRVIGAFGTATAVAKVVGTSRSAISQWRKRGGLIPSEHQRTLLIEASIRKLDLTAFDVIENYEMETKG